MEKDIEKLIKENATKLIEDIKAIEKENSIIYCINCRHLEISGAYGECGRAYLGIVSPYDYCSRAEKKVER